jgi:hypothetical protein
LGFGLAFDLEDQPTSPHVRDKNDRHWIFFVWRSAAAEERQGHY